MFFQAGWAALASPKSCHPAFSPGYGVLGMDPELVSLLEKSFASLLLPQLPEQELLYPALVCSGFPKRGWQVRQPGCPPDRVGQFILHVKKIPVGVPLCLREFCS